MLKQHLLIPLFQKFITSTKTGRRLNKNGTRIKPQSIVNYYHCLKLLEEFATASGIELIVFEIKGENKREHNKLKKYWGNFYKQFMDYLYKQKNCYDNYAGHNIKMIRSFFTWLNENRGIPTGPYYKQFYVTKEEIPIFTLSMERLKFLAFNKPFEAGLSKALQHSKDVFVVGCMVGLRFSDLCNLKQHNIECRDGHTYIRARSQKTLTDILVRLPGPAVEIIKKYGNNKKKLLPTVSLFRFNKNIKRLAELAGWIEPIYTARAKRGIHKEKNISGRIFVRFCDVLSSHTMRRTCITTMLSSGMPEYIVRKISGHTSDSKSFFRYVSLAQSLMDREIEKMHVHFEQPGQLLNGI